MSGDVWIGNKVAFIPIHDIDINRILCMIEIVSITERGL